MFKLSAYYFSYSKVITCPPLCSHGLGLALPKKLPLSFPPASFNTSLAAHLIWAYFWIAIALLVTDLPPLMCSVETIWLLKESRPILVVEVRPPVLN